MAKLTERQRKNIINAYAAGGVSQKDLAIKYGVCESTIFKLLKSRESEFTEKVSNIKKEEEQRAAESMAEFFAARRDKAQSIIDELLELSREQLAASSLRDKMGAVKILKECFVDPEAGTGDGKVSVTINLSDTSGGPGDG